MRRDQDRLLDVLDAIKVIEEYQPTDRAHFDREPMLQSHLFRHIMIIGEAVWKLSPPLKSKHPEVPWEQVQGMRHVLVHDHFQIDWNRIYRVATQSVHELKPHIQAMLRDVEDEMQKEKDKDR